MCSLPSCNSHCAIVIGMPAGYELIVIVNMAKGILAILERQLRMLIIVLSYISDTYHNICTRSTHELLVDGQGQLPAMAVCSYTAKAICKG